MVLSVPVPPTRGLRAWLAAVYFLCGGCGESPPRVYPAKGTVISKGKGSVKELAGYNIQLQSMTDHDEKPGGTIEADGSFTLYTRWGGKVVPGAKPGTYRITLQQAPVDSGRPPPLAIPVKYTRFEESGLTCTIEPRPNEIRVEVDRTGR